MGRHKPANSSPTEGIQKVRRRQPLRITVTPRQLKTEKRQFSSGKPVYQFERDCYVELRITRLVGMIRDDAASGDLRTCSSRSSAAASPISRIGCRIVVSAG